MSQLLNQINQKTLFLMLLGFTLLMLATSSVYGILPQVKEMKSGLLKRTELQELVENKDHLDVQKVSLVESINKLKRDLRGDMANLPEKKIEAFIIGELQNISWSYEIDLIGVKPVKGSEIQMFQEILFKVQLSGDYFDLYSWLQKLRSQLGFIVIKDLELSSLNNNDVDSLLLMKLTIASYKSMEE